jgi:hypothetical protein
MAEVVSYYGKQSIRTTSIRHAIQDITTNLQDALNALEEIRRTATPAQVRLISILRDRLRNIEGLVKLVESGVVVLEREAYKR